MSERKICPICEQRPVAINSRKGNKTHMKPTSKPYQPDYYELVHKRKQLDMQIAHPSWKEYL